MTSRLIYFVRHGETDWNAEGRIQGQCDVAINPKGKMQAGRNGRMLAHLLGSADGFDFVASPLGRTRETMELIRAAMHLAPREYRTDKRLVEVHFGDWQGLTLHEVDVRQPGIVARRDASKWDFLPSGAHAESYAMLAARVDGWLGEVRNPTICVTHGGVMRTLFHMVLGVEGDEAAMLHIPQDRILLLEDAALEWI